MKHLNQIVCGDCRELFKDLSDNSIGALATDPPYGLEFMGKEWDKLKRFDNRNKDDKSASMNRDNAPIASSPTYSGGLSAQIWHHEWATEALRVLKPGAHALVFGGSRTEHRMKCALEDAGFEIRDTITWLYGAGFPKNFSIDKGIDRKAFLEQFIEEHGRKPTRDEVKEGFKKFREMIGQGQYASRKPHKYSGGVSLQISQDDPRIGHPITAPRTELAKQWAGFGTALKPAVEFICLARKPLSERNIVENVLKHGTAGLNIDGSRIGVQQAIKTGAGKGKIGQSYNWSQTERQGGQWLGSDQGRWPANLILGCACEGEHEPGCAVRMLDEQSVISKSPKTYTRKSGAYNKNIYGNGVGESVGKESLNFGDFGGASRFFYCAKSSRRERNMGLAWFEEKPADATQSMPTNQRCAKCGGWKTTANEQKRCNCAQPSYENIPAKNNHPTVKPLKLMEYLVNLVTPPGGIVLDPFIGSGTTAMACKRLGFDYIGFEKEAEYVEIARARVAAVERGLF